MLYRTNIYRIYIFERYTVYVSLNKNAFLNKIYFYIFYAVDGNFIRILKMPSAIYSYENFDVLHFTMNALCCEILDAKDIKCDI